MLPQEIRQARHDHLAQVRLHLIRAVRVLCPHQRIDEKERLGDTGGEDAEGAQPHQPQLLVLERDRLLGAPLQIREHFEIDEIDLGTERAGEAPGEAQEPCEDGQVQRGERMPAGAEDVQALAVAEEHRRLTLAYDQLGSHLDVRRAFRGNTVHELPAVGIHPLDDFQQDAHAPSRLEAARDPVALVQRPLELPQRLLGRTHRLREPAVTLGSPLYRICGEITGAVVRGAAPLPPPARPR